MSTLPNVYTFEIFNNLVNVMKADHYTNQDICAQKYYKIEADKY